MYSKLSLLCLITYSSTFYTQVENSDLTSRDTIAKISSREKKIEGVLLVGKKTPYKMEAGKTTVNLESALQQPEGSLLDVLNRLPGVQIKNDGSVQLNGQTGTAVMIDGKLTYLSGENLNNFLKSLPASSIETVELISQPSAKYEANGNGGMINIIRKKNLRKGYSLRLSSTTEVGKYMRTTQTVGGIYSIDRFTLSVNYAYYGGENFTEVSSSRTYLLPQKSSSSPLTLDLEAIRKYTYGSHLLTTGIDYKISDSWNLGSYLTLNTLSRTKKEYSSTDFFTVRKISDSTFFANNHLDFRYRNLMTGLSISKHWKNKRAWDFSYDTQWFSQGDIQLQSGTMQNEIQTRLPEFLKGNTSGKINVSTWQTNINHRFYDELTLASGLKYTTVNIDSQARYKNFNENDWVYNPTLSSKFYYNERIAAAYLQIQSQWSTRWSTEVGLRAENSSLKGKYSVQEIQHAEMKQNDTQLFPSLTVQYLASEQHQLAFLYNRRILRPNYRDLNPFIEMNDRFLYEKGNTTLIPEKMDNLSFSWIFRKKYSFNIDFTHRKMPIAKSFTVEDKNRIIVMPQNLKNSYSAGIRFSVANIQILPWWSLQLNSNLIYRKFSWIAYSQKFSSSNWTPDIQVNNRFILPQKWTLEAQAYFRGRTNDGQSTINALGGISIGLRKNIFKDQFSLYIYTNDVLRTNRPHVDINGDLTKGWYRETYDSQQIGISIGYRLPHGKETETNIRKGKADENNRINL